jgi:HlyD family secretion protein
MRPRIFRSEALERLSSPEQLDTLLQIASPRYWLGLAAMLLLLTTATVWGYVGTVTTTVDGQAVIVRSGGVQNVVSQRAGMVVSLEANVGTRVERDRVVARVTQPLLLERLRVTRQAVAEALRERDRRLSVLGRSATLEVEALERQQSNTEREIEELATQEKLVKGQVAAEERLLAEGLVTNLSVFQAQEKLIAIRIRSSALQAQLKEQRARLFSLTSRAETETQADRVRLSQLRGELSELERERELAENITSPFTGVVTELKASEGMMVESGQAVLSVQSEVEDLELIGYVSAARAKETKVGMEVQVSPSVVKREEFGFIRGTVTHVSEYPATRASVMRNFANESLVDAFVMSGPVTEVWVRLRRDPRVASALLWSGLRRPDVTITSGTMCGIRIETRHQRPIDLVFPSVRAKLGVM